MKYFGIIFICVCLATFAQASAQFTLAQQGNDVVLQGSGTLNLTDLTQTSSLAGATGPIDPQQGNFATGAAPGSVVIVHLYGAEGEVNGPSSFGLGGLTLTNIGTGDRFGILSNSANFATTVVVPGDYQSFAFLAGTTTFEDQTIGSLGVNPGVYTWQWGEGQNADHISLTVIPEPSLAGAIILGFAMIGRRNRYRNN